MHEPAVAQHGDPVADPVELLHPVADVHHREPAVAQPLDHAEQRLDLAGLERRGRLVHDDHPGVDRDGPGEGDHLLRAHAEAAQRAAHVGVHAVLGEQAFGPGVHLGHIDDAEAVARLAPEQQVAGHAHHRHQVDLLVDGRDAGPLRLQRGGERHRLAPVTQLAPVGPVHPGEDLDEGRLAGAVLPDERVHLAGQEGARHLVEGEHPGESFGDPPGLEHRLRVGGYGQRSSPVAVSWVVLAWELRSRRPAVGAPRPDTGSREVRTGRAARISTRRPGTPSPWTRRTRGRR